MGSEFWGKPSFKWNDSSRNVRKKRPQLNYNSTGESQESLSSPSSSTASQQEHRSRAPKKYDFPPDRYINLFSIGGYLPEIFCNVETGKLTRIIAAASPLEINAYCQVITNSRDGIYGLLRNKFSANAVSVLLIFGTETFWDQFIDLFDSLRKRIVLLTNLEPAHAIRTILCHPWLTPQRFISLADAILINKRLTARSDLFQSNYSAAILTGLVAQDSYAAEALVKYLLPNERAIMFSEQNNYEIATNIAEKNPLLIEYIKGVHTCRLMRDLLNMMARHRYKPSYRMFFQAVGLCIPLYYDDLNGNWVAQLMINIAPEESRGFIDTCTRLDWIYSHVFRGEKARLDLCHIIQCALMAGPSANADTLAANFLLDINYDCLRKLSVDPVGNNIMRRVFECLTDLELCSSLRAKVIKTITKHFSTTSNRGRADRSSQNIPKYLKHLMGIAKSSEYSLRFGVPSVVCSKKKGEEEEVLTQEQLVERYERYKKSLDEFIGIGKLNPF